MSVVNANALHRLRDAAILYAPTIAASFVSYVLSSRQSLKIWIALQKTTTPSPTEVRKKSPNLTVLLIAVLCLFIPAYLAASQLTLTWGKLFLLPMLWYCTLSLFDFVSGSFPTSVHRNADGVPLLEVKRSHSGPRWLLILPPLAVAFTGLISDHFLNVVVPLTALYFTMCRSLAQSKFVLSQCIVVMLAMWFIVLAGAAITWIALLTKYNMHLTHEQKLKLVETINNFNSISLYWSNWIAPSFLAAFLSPLFSILLRFDYRNHCDASFDTDEFDNLAVVQPQKPSDGGLPSVGPGIALPDSMPRNFAKPYFYVAISAWLLTQFVCIVMGAFIHPKFVIPRMIYSIFSVPVSLLVTITFVMIVAVAGGEVEKLWHYTELWIVPPPDAEVQGAAATVEPVSNLDKESKEKSEQLASTQ